ncbi:MAG: hypothetical protein R3F59_19890 [Myxococcota bacterium]
MHEIQGERRLERQEVIVDTTEHGSILAMSRPLLWAILAAFVVVSIGGTWAAFGDAWGLARIVVAGVLMGTMSFYMLFINRLLVS